MSGECGAANGFLGAEMPEMSEMSEMSQMSEVTDLKTEQRSQRRERKEDYLVSVFFVSSVAPFLKSVPSIASRSLVAVQAPRFARIVL